MINFSQRLIELMEDFNINEKEIANHLEMDYVSMVYDWKNEICLPNFSNIIKIADLFKVNLDYMLGRTQNIEEVVSKEIPTFSEHFKKILKIKNSSQYKLLKSNIVSRGHLNSWLKNGNLPSVENLVKIADFLNISIDELVGRV
ncbi:MAG: transcriptional regulator [Clostridia bacterium]|nr:transcriptional regulator [Clostridia bacterium]